jgi:hypothetical protein
VKCKVPRVIYLQREDREDGFDDQTTWCAARINEDDIRYIIDKRQIDRRVKQPCAK